MYKHIYYVAVNILCSVKIV